MNGIEGGVGGNVHRGGRRGSRNRSLGGKPAGFGSRREGSHGLLGVCHGLDIAIAIVVAVAFFSLLLLAASRGDGPHSGLDNGGKHFDLDLDFEFGVSTIAIAIVGSMAAIAIAVQYISISISISMITIRIMRDLLLVV